MYNILKLWDKKKSFKKISFISGLFLVLGFMFAYFSDSVNLVRSAPPGCQLTMNKTDNGPVQPGSNVVYHLTLTNTGAANCTQTRIRDVFDQNTSFVSATMSYEEKTAAYIVWSLDTLAPGDSKTIDLTMKVLGSVQNNSTLSNSLQSCSAETSCSSFITRQTQVVQVASICQLTMSKTDNGPVLPGNNIIYHLTLTNTGTANCTQARIRDVFDQNTSFVSENLPREEKTAAYITWLLDTLAPGQSKTVDLTMKVLNSIQCNSTLSNSLQSCSVETLCSSFITKQTKVICCATNQDCSDGLACNGSETCSQGACLPGVPVDCSANNLAAIDTCAYIPDSNPFTLDRRALFASTCQESTGTCATSTTTIDHFCSAQCGGCAVDADCNDQNSNTADICNTGFGTGISVCQCQHSPIGTSTPACGNGVKEGAEQCDGSDGIGAHQTCSGTCTLITAPFCGDNTCNNQETCSSCPADCGGCGGGGGGGGGGGRSSGSAMITDLTFNNLGALSNLCSTVLIRWSTNQFASSRVLYDTVTHSSLTNFNPPNYGYASSTVLEVTPVTGHGIAITGLTPGATYYFRPVSTAAKEKFSDEIAVKVNSNCGVSPAPVKIIPPALPPQVLGAKITAKPAKHILKGTGFSSFEFELLGAVILLLAGGGVLLRKYEN